LVTGWARSCGDAASSLKPLRRSAISVSKIFGSAAFKPNRSETILHPCVCWKRQVSFSKVALGTTFSKMMNF
jgi:hypothetical protein